eukprot:TRINITY_DN3943_c0_g1_i2.p1 TRINITY_DN3943_c0_g1~~TRINITY_DN3943_c0_g1_i2.p1  ORF type:complete len:1330 (+),score=273.35 TRINITY_DN3943_c0_g1_i2:459-4448(+)
MSPPVHVRLTSSTLDDCIPSVGGLPALCVDISTPSNHPDANYNLDNALTSTTHTQANTTANHNNETCNNNNNSSNNNNNSNNNQGTSPPGKDFILVVDVSGSMSGQIKHVRETLTLVSCNIHPDTDRVGIVLFDHNAEVLRPLDYIRGQGALDEYQRCLTQIHARGGTNIAGGMKMALKHVRDVYQIKTTPVTAGDEKYKLMMEGNKGNETKDPHPSFSSHDLSDRSVVLILLSDGLDQGSRRSVVDITREIDELGSLRIVIHSFGYSSGHDAELLQALTLCGAGKTDGGGIGKYYSLESREDIVAAIGDLMGSMDNILVTNVRISVDVVNNNHPNDGDSALLPNWEIIAFNGNHAPLPDAMDDAGDVVLQPRNIVALDMMARDQRASYLFVARQLPISSSSPSSSLSSSESSRDPSSTSPSSIHLIVTVSYTDMQLKLCYETYNLTLDVSTPIAPLPSSIMSPSSPISSLMQEALATTTNVRVYCESSIHIHTQALRLLTATALTSIFDPAVESLLPYLESLHDFVFSFLTAAQQHDSQASLVDEGVLAALERDLGGALERVQDQSIFRTPQLRSKFLQYAHEHRLQRSSSTSTSVRDTYSTPEQVAMRLRFLYQTMGSGSNPTEAKATEKVDLDTTFLDLSPDEIALREQAEEDLACYITLQTWRDGDMGIGLVVLPRTSRERYKKLVPRPNLVPDYLSASAYNAGVKVSVANHTTSLDRDQANTEDHSSDGNSTTAVRGEDLSHTMVTSSSRGRINAWLPLYINATHWRYARTWAPSAFSIIATQFNGFFEPAHALHVCARLMIQTAVKFTIEGQTASLRTLQMFCDIHRLLLAMADDHPGIRLLAEQALTRFISSPAHRNRKHTPDLGDLIIYLTVTDKFSWSDLRSPYIVEQTRRAARFAEQFLVASIADEDTLIRTYYEKTTGARVSLFVLLFLDLVARPPGMTMGQIKDTYDRAWGRIPPSILGKLQAGYHDIMAISSLPGLFNAMGLTDLPPLNTAELILWAVDNKEDSSYNRYLADHSKQRQRPPQQNRKRKIDTPVLMIMMNDNHDVASAPPPPPPPVHDPYCAILTSIDYPYIHRWRRARDLFLAVERGPQAPALSVWHAPSPRSRDNLCSMGSVLHLLHNNNKDLVRHVSSPDVSCTCKKCLHAKELRRRTGSWLQQEVPPGDVLCRVFVGRLPYEVDEDTLRDMVGRIIGDANIIGDVKVVRNIHTGASRGYAFVDVARPEHVTQVVDHGISMTTRTTTTTTTTNTTNTMMMVGKGSMNNGGYSGDDGQYGGGGSGASGDGGGSLRRAIIVRPALGVAQGKVPRRLGGGEGQSPRA